MLTSILMPFVGFYLVTGSVKRDLERRIWPIVAATPTPRIAYLAGKMLSGFAYLSLLAAVSLIPATILFFRYGHGAFEPLEIVKPWLLLVPPSLLFTSAMALLFDVTPGLRGRGGYVAWFFTWSFLFFLIPAQLGGLLDSSKEELKEPAFDPAGVILVEQSIERAIGTRPQSLSLGVTMVTKPIHRVGFPAVPLTADLIAGRVLELGWSLGVLGLATLVFPFGMVRSERTASRQGRVKHDDDREQPAGPSHTSAHTHVVPRQTRPSFARSVAADAQLIWQSASWIKWPMAGASLLAFFLPGPGSVVCTAIVLILSAIVISEAAAREVLAGTASLVFAQPGVPHSAVAWKTASVGVFVVAMFASTIARATFEGPEHLAAIALALTFVVTASVGLGWLTRGGKFFSALFTAAWYVAIQGDLDFTGVFARSPDLGLCVFFAVTGLLLLCTAWGMERRRGR